MEQVYKKTGILFKILPCMLIVMYVVMCLIGSSVQATLNEAYIFDFGNHTITYDNKTYKINDDVFSKKYICFTSSGTDGVAIAVFCSDYPFYVDGSAYSSKSDKYYVVRSYDENEFYCYTFSSSNMHKALSYLQSWDLSHYSTHTAVSSYKFGTEYTYFSNFDIKDENDEVVFQGASQALAKQLEGIQLQEVMKEILQILPLILVVVVSFLGLRKALNWLLTLLRRS